MKISGKVVSSCVKLTCLQNGNDPNLFLHMKHESTLLHVRCNFHLHVYLTGLRGNVLQYCPSAGTTLITDSSKIDMTKLCWPNILHPYYIYAFIRWLAIKLRSISRSLHVAIKILWNAFEIFVMLLIPVLMYLWSFEDGVDQFLWSK